MIQDKSIERERFDSRALSLLAKDSFDTLKFGSEAIPLPLRSPYLFYEEKIKELIKPDLNVLEIGSGTGFHTYSLIKTGANVCATDISPNALKVLEKNCSTVDGGGGSLKTIVADMEQLPFENGLFDVVTIAGSLSYGGSKKVDNEIRRVIKTGGYFICVDSLNNNLIYSLNRYVHYLKKERSKMTLLNMPSVKRLEKLKQLYSEVEVNYFGAISFLTPFMKSIIGFKAAKKVSDKIDYYFRIKKSAFKFVLVAKV